MVSLLLNMFPSVGKASGCRLCTVCAEKYKTDFLFFSSSSSFSLNIRQDLKLYVVLPVLQHKTFIINLSNRASLTFTSYTSYQIVCLFYFFLFLMPRLPLALILKRCKGRRQEEKKEVKSSSTGKK